jgi:hypothetical protein
MLSIARSLNQFQLEVALPSPEFGPETVAAIDCFKNALGHLGRKSRLSFM